MAIEERRKFQALSKAYLSGELIPGLKYRHNSKVKVRLSDGTSKVGWIVAAEPKEPEAIYTIEFENGGPDLEVSQSNIELLHDSHV